MAITAWSFGTSTSTLTPTITFGFTANAGDLIIMAIGTDAAHTGLVATSPWVEFGAELTPTNARGGTFYLIASGGETQCTDIDATGTADRWEVVGWRIPAGEWHGTTPPERNTATTGSSVNPNSGNMAPSWGSETNNIFGTICVRDDSVANTITAYPTNYSTAQIDKNDITSCGNVGGAIRIVTAASDDAGNFTISASETWAAAAFAVRPAAAGATGTGAVTIGKPTLDGTGTETFTGTGAVTLPKPTLAGTGAAGASGTGAVTLTKPTLAGTGAETFTGSGGVIIAKPTLAGTGQVVEVIGTGGVIFAKPTLAGTGAETMTGTGAITITKPTLAATGTETITGTGAVTLPKPVLAATGTETITGTGAVTLPKPVLNGTGTETITGTGAVTLPKPAIAASGTHTELGPVTGTGAVTIARPTIAATGTGGVVVVVVPANPQMQDGASPIEIRKRARKPEKSPAPFDDWTIEMDDEAILELYLLIGRTR